MLDWLVRPRRLKTSPRRARRRRAASRILPSAPLRVGGGMLTDPFSLYPCTRMHGADFESEFYPHQADGISPYI
jgi:hypothetical protein